MKGRGATKEAFMCAAYPHKRVVLTQRPRKTSLKMGENLIAGDAPIVAYRRKRHELIEATDETSAREARRPRDE